eukprot:14919-Heterococcus_DN1.PRE.3
MRIVSTTVAALERDAAGGRSTKAAGRVSVADASKVSVLMMYTCIHYSTQVQRAEGSHTAAHNLQQC